MKINKTLKLIFVGFVSLSIFLAIFYIAGKKDFDNEAVSTSVSIKKPIIPSNVTKDNGQQAVANVRKQTPKIPQHESVAKKINEKPVQITPQENFLENKDIVPGVGLTVDELKALHERQMIEFSRDSDMPEFGIDGLTLEELQALHEKQSKEIASNIDWDEIVIASSGYGETGSGLTRAEVIRLHEEQNDEWVNTDEWDEIDPLEVKQDSPLLTTGDIKMLQDEQNINILRDKGNPYQSAPSLDEGGIDMTVQEIREMHSKQAKE